VERVTGIGGVFLRARNPEALRSWYEANLGISISEWGGYVFEAVSGTSTVWSIFAGDTGYWPLEQQVMVNYRVDDLDAMLTQLRDAGVEVDEKVAEQEFGRFGWAVDPEGNRIELWQPASAV
jgi:predicted enzyme related to lactoylglutathione lyase